MSYHRVLPPLPVVPLSGHSPDLASQYFPFLRPRVMKDQATTQASKSNTVKQSSPILENLVLRRETTPPTTDSLEDEESPKRARSSSPTFISRDNSQQLQKKPSMPSESKESPASLQGESPTSEVCLCQPDPKVPRPRNAFILYRQHHQSAVVEQNPGLSNPEISKVIGEHWKASTQEVQTHWRNLAEQEKLRHQRQYPDYRYQPRRGGRSHSISAGSLGDRENLKCQKCGGYSIPKSSGIMSTPGITSPPTDLVSPADRHPSTSSTNSIAYRSLRDPSQALGTAHFARSQASAGSYSSDLAALQLASPRLSKRSEPDSPRSPPPEESKRFRAVNGLGIQGLRGAPDTPYPFLRKPTAAESGTHHPRSEPVHYSQPQQHPTLKPGSGSFTMGPPPRPQPFHPGGNATSTPTSSSSGPLTLNPLHSISPTTLDSPASAQAKSLEAMVMSIPALNKIRLITQISPPLPPPSPSSPPLLRTRGFVIAIDGPEPGPVAQLTATVFNVLSESHPVKIFRGPEPFYGSGSICSGNDEKLILEKGEGKHDFQGYFETISAYHRISAEVVAFITSSFPCGSPNCGNPLNVNSTNSASNTSSTSTPPVSPKTTPASTQQQEANNISSTDKQHPHEPLSPTSSAPQQPTTTASPSPIALLPHFQLSHTDFSSSRIPITDNYAPVDHWQWMATLWRGIVGPDITIALLPPPPPVPVMQTPISGPTGGGAGGMMGTAGVNNRDLAAAKGKGGVEVRLDESPRVMLVRGGEGKGAGVGEGVLRRVGFELGEWVRGKEEERGV